MGFLSGVKSSVSSFISGSDLDEEFRNESEYLELNTDDVSSKRKVSVRLFVINEFADVKQVLDGLRQGNTIALLNVAPIRKKNMLDLKRLISKVKKTTDAIGGDLAGLSDDYIVATPSFASIHRSGGENKPLDNKTIRSESDSSFLSQSYGNDEGPVIMS